MKKLIIILFLASIAIFIGINLSMSAYSNKTNNQDLPIISYQVNIHPDNQITHNACPMMVQVTNGSGMLVGQPQLYHNGMNTYYFSEPGPVSGKRMAQLINADEGLPDDVCFLVSWWDSRSGTFYGGETYQFNLYDSMKNIIAPDDSPVYK